MGCGYESVIDETVTAVICWTIWRWCHRGEDERNERRCGGRNNMIEVTRCANDPRRTKKGKKKHMRGRVMRMNLGSLAWRMMGGGGLAQVSIRRGMEGRKYAGKRRERGLTSGGITSGYQVTEGGTSTMQEF